jgi:predicted RND superfamily exporter protein
VWTGEFTGYFTVRGTPLDSIKGTFVSAAGGSTFMSISVRATEDTAITDFIVALRQWCADYQTQFGGDSMASAHYTVGVTGLGALFYDVLNGSEKDMIKMDSIVLPLALTVLGFFLASFRLILVPIICVIVSLLSAFTLMLPVALYAFTVSSTTPSIMMSLALAMSFDYSLFLLSRFREEVHWFYL